MSIKQQKFMLNVYFNNNFASFLIFEFVNAVVCSCSHNFALKLSFSINFELFYSCKDSMHILEFEKSDSNVADKIINNCDNDKFFEKSFNIRFFNFKAFNLKLKLLNVNNSYRDDSILLLNQ